MSASIPEPGTRRLRRPLVVAALIVALVAAAWIGFRVMTREHYQFDYTSFETVEELGRAADDVVAGIVVGVRGRFVDRGGDPEFDEYGDPIPGIPMVVYDVKVDTPLKGTSSAGTVLPVAMVDLSEVSAAGITSIDTGEPVLLFLTARTPESAPDITTVADQVWVIISGDNGILDVHGEVALPRSAALERLSSADESQQQFELRAIEDVLAN